MGVVDAGIGETAAERERAAQVDGVGAGGQRDVGGGHVVDGNRGAGGAGQAESVGDERSYELDGIAAFIPDMSSAEATALTRANPSVMDRIFMMASVARAISSIGGHFSRRCFRRFRFSRARIADSSRSPRRPRPRLPPCLRPPLRLRSSSFRPTRPCEKPPG